MKLSFFIILGMALNFLAKDYCSLPSAQSAAQAGNTILNYPTPQQQSNSAGSTNTDCTNAVGLCNYQQSLCNSANEYLQTTDGTDHSPLMNYSVCPLYRPALTTPANEQIGAGTTDHTGLGLHHTNTLQPPDDVCFMIEPPTDLHATASGTLTSGGAPQGLNWQAFMVDKWYCMRDRAMQDITHDEVTSGFIVEADKGFNYSQWDESFVCQKKNHFQISVQLKLPKVAKYLKKSLSEHEMEVITCFGLHLHGMKFEAADSLVMIEQSRTDRSKLAYEPLLIDLPNFPDQLVKVSACRLHFSETTANNMRKRGKPNPDQRYFSLVVSLHAYTASGNNYPVIAYVSERIIVRASNPGQFDNEGDSTWLKGVNSNGADIVFYQGKVGINTESPEEALTVVGNVQVTGQILQPSDARLKTDISKMSTTEMLYNMQQLTLYSYHFQYDEIEGKGEGREESEKEKEGKEFKEVGLLAQDVETIIPGAVKKVSINDKEVLVLNKDRIMMECIGALQELASKYEHSKNNRYTPKLSHLLVILIIIIVSLLCVAAVIVTSILL